MREVIHYPPPKKKAKVCHFPEWSVNCGKLSKIYRLIEKYCFLFESATALS